MPLKLTREKTGKKAKLDLKAQIMICKDICIPQPFDVKLDVPTKGDFTQSDAIIAEAKQKLPHKNPAHGISIDTVVVAQDFLVLSVTSQNGFEGMDVFPVVEEDFWGIAGEPQIDVSEHDPKKAIIKIAAPVDEKNLASAIQEKTLSVTLTHQGQALEYVMEY